MTASVSSQTSLHEVVDVDPADGKNGKHQQDGRRMKFCWICSRKRPFAVYRVEPGQTEHGG
jgi:hypothetical protein